MNLLKSPKSDIIVGHVENTCIYVSQMCLQDFKMPKIKHILFTFALLAFAFPTFAMVYDNQFIPLLRRTRLDIDGCPSLFAIDLFADTASSAYGPDEEQVGLPSIYGVFDQGQLGIAMRNAGCPDPMRTDWQNFKVIWDMNGKLQTQGAFFTLHKTITDWLAIGASWMFMRANSSHEFSLGKHDLELGRTDILQLDENRRQMFEVLGLRENQSAQVGFGDVDLYLRFSRTRDYYLKFKRFDVGGILGVLIPSGLRHNPSQPTSIPFGGNGHWGIYGAIDGLFELKDDMKAGIYFRFSKRFPKIENQRIPAGCEPIIFGALCGPVRVNPGFTFVFNPYFVLENLRDGLGAGVYYNLTLHQKDKWDPQVKNGVPVGNIDVATAYTRWRSEYITLNAFYDFGKIRAFRTFDPILTVNWDIPVKFLVAQNVFKTYRVALGVQFAF